MRGEDKYKNRSKEVIFMPSKMQNVGQPYLFIPKKSQPAVPRLLDYIWKTVNLVVCVRRKYLFLLRSGNKSAYGGPLMLDKGRSQNPFGSMSLQMWIHFSDSLNTRVTP